MGYRIFILLIACMATWLVLVSKCLWEDILNVLDCSAYTPTFMMRTSSRYSLVQGEWDTYGKDLETSHSLELNPVDQNRASQTRAIKPQSTCSLVNMWIMNQRVTEIKVDSICKSSIQRKRSLVKQTLIGEIPEFWKRREICTKYRDQLPKQYHSSKADLE